MLNLLRKLLPARWRADAPPSQPMRDSDLHRLFDGPALGRERALTMEARRWLVALPEYAWPKRLCVLHPAIANRLADLWTERARCEEYFVDLLMDDAVMAADTAAPLRAELIRLESYYRKAMDLDPDEVSVERRESRREH
jgi:hypothetical protein